MIETSLGANFFYTQKMKERLEIDVNSTAHAQAQILKFTHFLRFFQTSKECLLQPASMSPPLCKPWTKAEAAQCLQS